MRYIIVLTTLSLTGAILAAQPSLKFKVPSSRASRNDAPIDQVESPVSSGRGHLVLEFEVPPSRATVDALRMRGANVLRGVPDNGLLVSTSGRLDLSDLNVKSADPLPATSKMSPLLSRGTVTYVVVEFHPDVNMSDARRLILNAGLTLHENPDIGQN